MHSFRNEGVRVEEKHSDDFVIDVAKEHKYQNQTDEYYNKFLKWRTDPKNPFGYKFVQDTRVHAYVDGEGYLKKDPAQAEKKALSKCCAMLAAVMIIMMLCDAARYVVINKMLAVDLVPRTYYSKMYDADNFSTKLVYVSIAFNIMKFLVPLLAVMLFSRLPVKVAMPSSANKQQITAAGVVIMLMIMVFGRIANYAISQVLEIFGIDSVYYDYMVSDDPKATIAYFVSQILIVPVLMELFFRGYLLQLFRQFGDFFAVLIVSIVNALCVYSLSLFAYVFFASMFVGFFTIRSGSIKTPIIMRITVRASVFALSYLSSSMLENNSYIFECAMCLIIAIGFVLVFINGGYTTRSHLDVSVDDSNMTVTDKLKVVMTSVPMSLWALASIGLAAASVRFI